MANEEKGPWWVVGVQIQAAMEQDLGKAFLIEHASQATDAGLGLLRTIPIGSEVDLAQLVEDLGEQILAHTRFLCIQAELTDAQADRLMAASRYGFHRFMEAYRAEVRSGRGRTAAGLLSGIEATLEDGAGREAIASPALTCRAPELRPQITTTSDKDGARSSR
ncbi:hypothetical protein ACYOEI_03920 [Singulisphaera rosea]